MMMRRRFKRARGQRGAALLMAIAAAALLTAIAVELIDSAQGELRLVESYRDDFRARWAARAPVALAIETLKEDGEGFTGFTQKWAELAEDLEVGGVKVRFRIEDESSKFNFNALASKDKVRQNLVSDMLKAIFSEKDIDTDYVDYLRDWIDEDKDETASGGEGSYYRSLAEPYDVKNALLDSLSELGLVRGFSPTILKKIGLELSPDGGGPGVHPTYTVFSDEQINLNTASRELLNTLSNELPDSFIQDVLDRREQEPIQKVENIKTMAGMSEEIFKKIS
ncbi:MAG: type II secretion system minor pseudopilin GspK, partial [Nitrospinaceae bacterium]|nr:type II secretion system minor pseudopilin GspK [Nitrospinaceae bacterium]